jgi:hypothetical protein
MHRFTAEIERAGALPTGNVRERLYGNVRVSAEWRALHVELLVSGEIDRRDAPAYVELFFHDVFLLLNLSEPGSFGGTITMTGGELRVRTLTFDARVFATAAPLETLPLEDVLAWYDRLDLGTRQLVTDALPVALVQLLHLARSPENEYDSILRLALAAEALGLSPPRLFELRDDLAHGRAPVIHPMHDDALDPRVEDATREWIDAADAAARAVIGELQRRIKSL